MRAGGHAITRRRSRLRSVRRRLAALALLAPSLVLLAADLARRPRQIAGFDAPHALGYLGSLLGSALIWAVILAASSRRRGLLRWVFGAIFVATFTLVLGVQGAFHQLYNTYLSMDSVLTSDSFAWAMMGTLPLGRAFVWAHLGTAIAVAAGVLAFAQKVVRPGRAARILAPILVPAVAYGAATTPVSFRAVQSTSADLIYFHGLATLGRELTGLDSISAFTRPQRHVGEPVPKVEARPARPRNVVFILQESLRADVTCSAYDPACDLPARAVNPLLPGRMPFLQMRSNAGVTAVSVAVLWSGVTPTAPRETLLTAPLLWEYARAAGYDTGYFTNQDLTSYGSRLFVQDAGIAHRTSGTELDPTMPEHTGPRDLRLADHVLARWGELREPFFVVVQLCNVHSPYLIDEDDAPYQPQAAHYDAAHGALMRNRYRNAAYASDKAVARLVAGLRATESGRRSVILFTSDHGEMFHDDPGGYYGHSWTVRDEEVHVPGWIDAPAGTVTEAEAQSLRAAREELVYHLDVAPTVLDLLGLWDAPAIAPQRGRMVGHPLTRPGRTTDAVPMTSQTWIWDAWEPNFGMMHGTKKVFAQKRDDAFHCFDLAADPGEERDLGEEGCPDLVAAARREYGGLPSEVPAGRFR